MFSIQWNLLFWMNRFDQVAFAHFIGLVVLWTWILWPPTAKPDRPMVVPLPPPPPRPCQIYIQSIVPPDEVVRWEKPLYMPAPPEEESPAPLIPVPATSLQARLAECLTPEHLHRTLRFEEDVVIVGTERHVLSLFTGRTVHVYEPNWNRFLMIHRSHDLTRVKLYHGLFSEEFSWLQIDAVHGYLQPYDLRYKRPYDDWVAFKTLPMPRTKTHLVFSSAQYYLYYARFEPDILQRFRRVYLLSDCK